MFRVHRENITYPGVGMLERDTFGCLPDSPDFVAPKLTLFSSWFETLEVHIFVQALNWIFVIQIVIK